MKIVVGLGNPGAKYETTRHNVGFLAVDRLVELWKGSGPIQKFNAEIYQASLGGESVLLMKPQTFMNLSGKSVAAAMGFYQVKPSELIVIHDDLALQSMSLRFKAGGGAGGHNGLRSIDECLGKENSSYFRIRIGIGHPSQFVGDSSDPRGKMSPANYVLAPYHDQELEALDPVLEDVGRAAEWIFNGEIQRAMNTFHSKKE